MKSTANGKKILQYQSRKLYMYVYTTFISKPKYLCSKKLLWRIITNLKALYMCCNLQTIHITWLCSQWCTLKFAQMIFSKKFHVIRRSWNRVNRGPLSRRVNPSPCFKAVKTTIDLNFASLWRLHRVNQSCAKSALEFEIVKCKIPWIYQTLNQLSLADILGLLLCK